MNLTEEQIREYYRTCPLELRYNSKFKYLKFKLFKNMWFTCPYCYRQKYKQETCLNKYCDNYNGEMEPLEWKMIKRKVSNKNQLRKWLVKYAPKAAYQSVAEFLDFKKLEHPDFKANCILLYSPFWVDIDASYFNGSMEDARKEAVRVHEYLKKELRLESIKNSGRGVHLYYDLPRRYFRDVKQRWSYYQALKEKYTLELLSLGFKIDAKITKNDKLQTTMIDLLRISRLENSIRPSGEICKTLSISELYTPSKGSGSRSKEEGTHFYANKSAVSLPSLFYSPARHNQYTQNLSLKGSQLGESMTTFPSVKKASEVATGTKPSTQFKYITNRVLTDKVKKGKVRGDADGFILHLRLKKYNRERIKAVQRTYNTGTLYVYSLEEGYSVLGVKKMNYSRIVKIMKASRATNLVFFEKYAQTFIRTSKIINSITEIKYYKEKGIWGEREANIPEIVSPAPKLLEVLKATTTGEVSQRHQAYIDNTILNNLGIEKRLIKELIKEQHPKIYELRQES